MARFRKEQSAQTKEPSDPFAKGKREWNDRLGKVSSEKRFWKLAALMALGISIPANFYALQRSGQTKVIPYVIEVDSFGNVRGAGSARRTEFKQEYIIEAALSNFIINFRGVTVDGQLQKQRIDNLYQYIGVGSSALQKINTHFQSGNDPFLIAKAKTVSVRVVSVNEVAETSSYNVEWVELDYDRNGIALEERRYQGIVTYRIIPPQKEAVIRTNPLGIYVIDLDYSEKN